MSAIATTARELALEGFAPPAGPPAFPEIPAFTALAATGTRLWLDTGDLDAARALWCPTMSALTTNNTLVNREVQKGLFDTLIPEAAAALRAAQPGLSAEELVTEVGFVVNCRTALRLVAAFDAYVSVELHPGMAEDAALSLEYGRRYFAVCPERFIVKVPLTPAGFLAARGLAAEGIPVNYTLGFSARQNVLAAAFSRPAYVNVFMGRLNSFVKDSGLGDGLNVGERATMATQVALRVGREQRGWTTRLIGASMRSGAQLYDLAGLDVFTMPTAAAAEFRQSFEAGRAALGSQVGRDFPVVASEPAVLSRLWEVDDAVAAAGEALARVDTAAWTGADFATAVRDSGLADLFRPWTAAERDEIRSAGKIPAWSRWADDLRAGRAALDDLMTQAALYSFVTDQAELDARIRGLL
jgi:transaldolase